MIDLPRLWAEAKAFLAVVRFDAPDRLWLSLLPLAVTLVGWWVGRRHRKRAMLLGRPGAVAGLRAGPRPAGRWSGLLLTLGWLALTLGAAGPRWGTATEDGIAVGRDVVVCVDLSRSMWTDDVSGERWKAAIAGTRELAEAATARGGHRIAVVVFAGRPKLLVPLTTDVEHVAHALAGLDARTPPAEVRPSETAPSGTRIGAAISAAVAAHDSRFPGYQDIILLTDADDPANDEEWRTGVSAARKAGVPVHVVGLGDPVTESLVFRDGRPLEFTDPNGAAVPVQSRLHEDVARAIATEGRGVYLPARRDRPRLAEFFRQRIDGYPSKELSDDVLPRPPGRSAGFLLAAAGLFAIGWWRKR